MVANPSISLVDMRFESKHRSAETTVRAVGRITSDTATALEGKLHALIPDFKRIVLDLSCVDYVDNSGLATLANIYFQARQADCDLEIDNPKVSFWEWLRARLEAVFKGHDDMLGMTPD